MSNVYSSLLSQSPSATAYSLDLESLLPGTSSSPTPNRTATSTTVASVTSLPPSLSSSDIVQSPASTVLTGGPIETPSNPPSTNSLTASAIAGITIGAATGLALLGAAIFFLLRRQKRTANELDGNPYAGRYDVDGVVIVHGKYEHYASELIEVAAERDRAELLSPNQVHELAAVERSELEGCSSDASSGSGSGKR
jgi:hypothetical protein